MTTQWLRIAHRGASGSAPEHTRPAFERALNAGADMIELDVQLSRDGELMVMHDLDLQRTTSTRGAVRDYDLAELKKLDAGSWFDQHFCGEPILTLDEVLTLVAGRARLNVEVKAPATDWPAIAPRLVKVLREYAALESTVISCFDAPALEAVRAQSDDARLGLLWQHTDFTDAWPWLREFHAVSIHPFWMLASSDVIHRAHALGVQVLTWTVNDIAAMRSLVRLGVDGIMSDFPERFADVDDAPPP